MNGTDTSPGQQHAERARRAGEHEALGQQLAQQPRSIRARRRANGELGFTLDSADQLKMRYVRAGDQQHDADRRQQHPERTLELADDDVAKGEDACCRRAVRVRIRLRQPAIDVVEIRLCLLRRYPRSETADGVQQRVATLFESEQPAR
jgi:hypothetical protein